MSASLKKNQSLQEEILKQLYFNAPLSRPEADNRSLQKPSTPYVPILSESPFYLYKDTYTLIHTTNPPKNQFSTEDVPEF
ncbi:hypothetical protein [Pedobacter nyackensis]|uniref:hypothetical protein n=1 Tax=Pedobacter nyackensis TaxID=475255 RepID=UPI00292F3F2F|nr:hypothetical protein [Pedobacter nyackensis]